MRDFLVMTHSADDEIDMVDRKIVKTEVSLQDMKKKRPVEDSAILSQDVIDALNTRYLPIMKRLYDYVIKFLAGDEKAFMPNSLPLPQGI